MVGFCETDDVREALQKAELKASIGEPMVEPAIEAASRWFANATNGHWYDSGGGSNQDLVPTSDETASNVRLDVPSSPHRQDAQLFASTAGRVHTRYPVTKAGPYAKIRLPHLHVGSLSKLEVRDRDGGVTDWVADSSITQGRGNDYYVQAEGQDSYGKTYLYVRARTIGPRHNFDDILTVEYSYGLDWQTEVWDGVRRGIANLAAADVIDDDDVISQVPEQGTIVGLDTQHDNLSNRAAKYLNPYL